MDSPADSLCYPTNTDPTRVDPGHSTLTTQPWWSNAILRAEFLSARSRQRRFVTKWYKAKESLKRDVARNSIPSLPNVNTMHTLTNVSSRIQSHVLKYPNSEESDTIGGIHRKLCDEFMARRTSLVFEIRKLQIIELEEQINTTYSTCEHNLKAIEVSNKKDELKANIISLLAILAEDRENFTISLEFKTAAKLQKEQLAIILKSDKLEIDMDDPEARTIELFNRMFDQKFSMYLRQQATNKKPVKKQKPAEKAKTSPPVPKNRSRLRKRKQAVPKTEPQRESEKNVSPPPMSNMNPYARK